MKPKRATVGLVACILLMLSAAAYAGTMPSFQETRRAFAQSDAVLLDRYGKVLHELRVDPTKRQLEWVPLKAVSPALVRAVVQSEDKRFYKHSGIDWIAVGSSIVKGLFNGSHRGASTITMQLAACLDKSLKPDKTKRTAVQKFDQMKAALTLEQQWTKDEILEAYLNLVSFKGEIQGVSAAARGLYDKEPSGLDEYESLVLAALIRAPNASAEIVAQRACRLGMGLGSGAQCDGLTALARKTRIGHYVLHQRARLAPQVAYYLLQKGKPEIRSTLDGPLQSFAAETLRYQLKMLKTQNVNEGAALVVDNKSGDVLAYVVTTSDESEATYVDGVKARRQAGSTLKPFLYALSFEKRLLTPASLLKDSPLDLPTALGVYRPDDYENNYKGVVSARLALASSLNIPAVRVVGLTGVRPFLKKLRLLGFDQLKNEDYYGPSIALGSADVSLYELVNAYRTLANGGIWSDLRMSFEQSQRKKVRAFSEPVSFMITDILSDREARGLTFGLENSLSTRFWSAVKTGTSKDMRDNWCIGLSGKYTVGVWVGNFSGEPMWNVSGVTGAAPAWLEIMNWLHRDVASVSPAAPKSVVAQRIEFTDVVEPSRTELFLQGTETAKVSIESGHKKASIVYPADGTIVAIDPDIPEDNQRIFFESQNAAPRHYWVLNGKTLGAATEAVAWKPERGRHTLALKDDQNNIIDTMKFEVR
ncbi:MAG: penicillin-binding protein 1C [Nitrospirae bacterium]|nr:penicillin-binding protein 1C [Nitrospirota bacterium]